MYTSLSKWVSSVPPQQKCKIMNTINKFNRNNNNNSLMAFAVSRFDEQLITLFNTTMYLQACLYEGVCSIYAHAYYSLVMATVVMESMDTRLKVSLIKQDF